MILLLLNTQKSICGNTVYEIYMALKADSMAYEYQLLHQHNIYKYVHHGLTAKTAHITKWQTLYNTVQHAEINTFIWKMLPCMIGFD